MEIRLPDARAALIMLVTPALMIGLSVWAWGSWSEFVAHPARLGACVVVALSSFAALFSGANLRGLDHADRRTRWIIPLAIVVTLAMAWAPAYADRRGLATIDGDMIRYIGLALFVVGCVLRVGPTFALGTRFRAPWLKQEEHRLVTTGFYRFIRHPSYLGVLLAMPGWFLLFRCGIGIVLGLLLIPATVFWLPREEAMLLEEFGEDYAAYTRRTWRLWPFVY
jgi:protein-S-isoprenylcysteine O-methyltransferase Ste14